MHFLTYYGAYRKEQNTIEEEERGRITEVPSRLAGLRKNKFLF